MAEAEIIDHGQVFHNEREGYPLAPLQPAHRYSEAEEKDFNELIKFIDQEHRKNFIVEDRGRKRNG